MVVLPPDFDLKRTVVMDGPFGPQETERLAYVLSTDVTQVEALRNAVDELNAEKSGNKLSPAGHVRLGVAYYLLGLYEAALVSLKEGDGGALALFYLAKTRFALSQFAESQFSTDQLACLLYSNTQEAGSRDRIVSKELITEVPVLDSLSKHRIPPLAFEDRITKTQFLSLLYFEGLLTESQFVRLLHSEGLLTKAQLNKAQTEEAQFAADLRAGVSLTGHKAAEEQYKNGQITEIQVNRARFICFLISKGFLTDDAPLPLAALTRSALVRLLYAEVLMSYDAAQKAGYSADECTLGRAEVYRCLNNPEEALKQLDMLQGAVEQTAEYLYQRGAALSQLLYDEEGNILTEQAVKLYARAVKADKRHSGALFGLAMEYERRGYDDDLPGKDPDEDPLSLYKRAISRFPTHSGALFNLGVLYEDLGLYDQAVVCFQRIADAQPGNRRARLFFKDAKASSEMHIDEETQRGKDRLNQILAKPVTDFELSVRSRNCLRTMGIGTLRDLCAHTEQDLLMSKNFGETSLLEIREMLSLNGLKLGLFAQERPIADAFDVSELSPEVQAVLENSVMDLNLSVRARKCMTRLNIQTIGELVRKTADELLECKNFGVTSLNEIREKLATPPFDLKLRGE